MDRKIIATSSFVFFRFSSSYIVLSRTEQICITLIPPTKSKVSKHINTTEVKDREQFRNFLKSKAPEKINENGDERGEI